MKKVFKKYFSVLLIMAVLFSPAALCASAEPGSVTIHCEVVGSGVGRNDKGPDDFGSFDQWSPMNETCAVGTAIKLSAEPNRDGLDDEEGEDLSVFLYWLNKETNRVLSFDPEYTFYAATDASIEAVFDDLPEDYAGRREHRVIYLSSGDNIIYSMPNSNGDKSYFEESIPSAREMDIGGKTFSGWDHTVDEVAAARETVIVRPQYSEDANTYRVMAEVGDDTYVQYIAYGETAKIEAPATLNGAPFSYWVARAKNEYDEDQIVSYNASYSFIVTMDQKITAVYGGKTGNGVATRVLGDNPNFEASTITFYAEHSVTDDYTVLQHGLLLSLDPMIGNNDAKFIIGAPNVTKGTSKDTTRAGTYVVTKRNWYDTMQSGGETVTYYPLAFVRSYIIVKDSNGATQTVYSPIYVADYVNVAFKGILEGDNYDDPFAG